MRYDFRFKGSAGVSLSRGFAEKMKGFTPYLDRTPYVDRKGYTQFMSTWRTELAIGEAKMPVFIIYDYNGDWPKPSCKHCIVAGCKVLPKIRYHMVVPLEEEWHDPLLNPTILDNPQENCLLYTVIHENNGFAHLLWVQRSSSGLMSGTDIMDFWDYVCKFLEIRDVTLEDVSKVGNVDLPILHGVAHGRSWFARWGYKYWEGSFGVDKVKFEIALSYMRDIDICKVAELLEDRSAVDTVINRYKELSPEPIKTLSAMLRFILTYPEKVKLAAVARAPNRIPLKRWKRKEINMVLAVLLPVLAKSRSNPVTKEALMVSASSINCTDQLLEHVICSLKNLKYGESRMVICREDVASNMLEYSLEYIPILTEEKLDVHHDAAVVYTEIIQKYPESDEMYSMLKMAEKTIAKYKYLLRGSQLQCGEKSGKTVECRCGAAKDDGETLVQCEMCDLYEHLECSGLASKIVHTCDRCLTEEKEKHLLAEAESEAEKKSTAEINSVEEDELNQI